MAELQPIIVFHRHHFVRHLEICNPICVKLLHVMSGVILRNLKNNDISISNRIPGVHKRDTHTHTHTHTHTNAMHCISPKNSTQHHEPPPLLRCRGASRLYLWPLYDPLISCCRCEILQAKFHFCISIFIVYESYVIWLIRTLCNVSCQLSFYRVVYCKVVLIGLLSTTLAPLQRVLNAAARFVAGTVVHTNVSGIMMSLHCLLIAYRIQTVCPNAQREQQNQSSKPVRH